MRKFAEFLSIEINNVDADKCFNIIFTANKGKKDESYLPYQKNRFDLKKSLNALYSVKHYYHDCKKTLCKNRQ